MLGRGLEQTKKPMLTLERINWEVTRNVDRVHNLAHLYKSTTSGKGRKSTKESDPLRAAVIMLHATQESFLRQLLTWKFQKASSTFFTDIRLVGGKERFTLVDLAEHRDKSVEEVLRLSLVAHLDRSTFNNVGDLKETIALLGVDSKALSVDWKTLGELMDRRHAIVHRGDMTSAKGRGKHFADSISPYSVGLWIEAFTCFSKALNAAL